MSKFVAAVAVSLIGVTSCGGVEADPGAREASVMPASVVTGLESLRSTNFAPSADLIHLPYDEFAQRTIGGTALHYATSGAVPDTDRISAEAHAEAFEYSLGTAQKKVAVEIHADKDGPHYAEIPPEDRVKQAIARIAVANPQNLYVVQVDDDHNIGYFGTSEPVPEKIPIPAVTMSVADGRLNLVKRRVKYDGKWHETPGGNETEACQAAIKIEGIDNPEDFPHAPASEIAYLAKEAVCNALGGALQAARNNSTYQVYFDTWKNGAHNPFSINSKGYVGPTAAVDQPLYEAIARKQQIDPNGHLLFA